MFHNAVPHDGSARVPFIVEDRPSAGGAACLWVVDHVVELRDLMPTLLDRAGLPIPQSVDGRSLAPYLSGTGVAPVHKWLHVEHLYRGQSLQWVIDGKTKCVWGSAKGVEQLSTWSTILELHNLVDE